MMLRPVAGATAMGCNDAGRGLATSLDNAGTLTSLTRDPQGHLLSYRVGNTPASTTNHYYLLDSVGTVIGTTNPSGNRDATYYYEPFGAATNQTGTAAAANPMRFQGGYLDPTGWYHYGQRYYNPTTGRWSQPDPRAGDINEPKDINRYLFAGDDPINNTDPTGEDFGDVFMSAVHYLDTAQMFATGLSLGSVSIGAGFELGGFTAAAVGLATGVTLIGAAAFVTYEVTTNE